MAQIPFPSENPGGRRSANRDESGQGRRDDDALTVSELSRAVKAALADSLERPLRVIGEVSNLSKHTHWFFSLKDEDSSLRCVCFASAARRVGFDLKDGMEVVCTGRVDYYEAQGSVQLYVDRIKPVGQGALELRFRALCEQLKQLGYFADQHKLQIPPMPQRVAVVTSRSAAALADVIKTASKRWPGCRLYLFDVRVQGESAAGEIAEAINAISKGGPDQGIDAIILTRGGGSIEDLWAFNERVVADAVFNCRVPIVAAIGHETDTTVAELVADVRCSTPTQAAMTLIPDSRALKHQVDQLAHRLSLSPRRSLQHSRQRLEAVSRHPLFRRPQYLTEASRKHLDHLIGQLQGALPRAVGMHRDHLEALSRQLEAVGPMNVLRRGFTYTLGPQGQVLRDPGQVQADDRMTTVMATGRVESQVIGTQQESEKSAGEDQAGQVKPKLKPKAKRKLGKGKFKSSDQASLF